MSPLSDKVLTTALLAASCFNSAFDSLAEEIKIPGTSPNADSEKHSDHILRYKIDGHSLIVIPTEGEPEIDINTGTDLQGRYHCLKKYLENEIKINYYFLPIRHLKEKSLSRLHEDCAAINEKLAAAKNPEEIEKLNHEFRIALEKREYNAMYKGYSTPGFVPARKLYCPESQSFWIEMICPYNPSIVKLVNCSKENICTRTYINNKLRFVRNENREDGSAVVDEYATRGYIHARKNYSVYNGQLRLENSFTFNADGSVLTQASFFNNSLTYYDKDSRPLAKLVYSKSGEIASREMYSKDGKPYGTFIVEKEKNPALTADAYIDHLAANLDTWEKHHYFLKLMLDYKRFGKPITPIPSNEETLTQGYGNCLAFAFLEREILLRQGFQPNVVSLEREHAACFVITMENGHYYSRIFCNWGFDENGNRYGHPVDPVKAKGYGSPVEAYNSTVKKYRFKSLGLAPGEVYQVENEIDIMKKVETQDGQEDNRAYESRQIAKLVSFQRKN